MPRVVPWPDGRRRTAWVHMLDYGTNDHQMTAPWDATRVNKETTDYKERKEQSARNVIAVNAQNEFENEMFLQMLGLI